MDLTGKNVIVTGANSGIGRVTALELARKNARVILACRSQEKTLPVVREIAAFGGTAEFLPLDLSDLSSVRSAATAFLAKGEPLAVLVNNAGIAGAHGLTKDGFELTFGTNHLGPYLFTRMLIPALDRNPASRVVNVASKGHYRAKALDWTVLRAPAKTRTGFPEYCVSKLANVLFASELARKSAARGSGVHAYSLHPGVVASDVWRSVPWGLRHAIKMFMLSNEDGAKTTIYCATSDQVRDQSGLYYDSQRETRPSTLARDERLAKELWDRSAEWVGLPA